MATSSALWRENATAGSGLHSLEEKIRDRAMARGEQRRELGKSFVESFFCYYNQCMFRGIDPRAVAELEHLIAKLANNAPSSAYTSRDKELIEVLRQNGDVIMSQFAAVMRTHTGRNDAGKEKLENLRKALDRICDRRG